jgi:hypothetical protein
MNPIRLQWEPTNKTPLPLIEQRMMLYTKGQGGIIMLGNGTLLSLTEGDDDIDDAKKALNEARFIIDFRVVSLKEGGYMVDLHSAVAVFVGQREFEEMRNEIISRQHELLFPSEKLFVPPNTSPDDTLVGLYGRGKLQGDAYNFSFYKRLHAQNA